MVRIKDYKQKQKSLIPQSGFTIIDSADGYNVVGISPDKR